MHPLDQKLGGLFADPVRRLTDRGQPRTNVVRNGNVVESDYRQVLAGNESSLARRMHRPERQQVVAGEQRSRPLFERKKLACRFVSVREGEVAVHEACAIQHQPGLGESAPETVKPLHAHGKSARSRDHRDAAMAELEEVSRRQVASVFMVHFDEIRGDALDLAVDDHYRYADAAQQGPQLLVCAGRHQYEAVDAPAHQHAHVDRLLGAGVVGVAHDQAVPLLEAFVFDPAHQLGEKRVADVRDYHRHSLAVPHAKAARDRVGRIAERGHGSLDARPHRRADIASVIEHVRHGRYGDVGAPGHIRHRRHDVTALCIRRRMSRERFKPFVYTMEGLTILGVSASRRRVTDRRLCAARRCTRGDLAHKIAIVAVRPVHHRRHAHAVR